MTCLGIVTEDFCGHHGDPAPKTKERGEKIKKLLAEAYNKRTKSFSFAIRDTDVYDSADQRFYTIVCEGIPFV